MIHGIMRLINDTLLGFKKFLFGDMSWDVLFFVCVVTALAIWYLNHRFRKSYDAEATKKSLILGLGYLLHWTYCIRNAALSFILAFAGYILYLSGVTAGATNNGNIADMGTTMTTTKTGFWKVEANFAKEGGKDCLYVLPVNPFAGDGIATDTTGKVFKAGAMDVFGGTNLEPGSFVGVSLINGQSMLGNVSTELVEEWCKDERESLWNSCKNFVSNTYQWIKDKIA